MGKSSCTTFPFLKARPIWYRLRPSKKCWSFIKHRRCSLMVHKRDVKVEEAMLLSKSIGFFTDSGHIVSLIYWNYQGSGQEKWTKDVKGR